MPPDRVPRTTSDLLKPEWKGMLASTPYGAFFDVLGSPELWGPERVVDFTRQYRDSEKREVARERHLGPNDSSSGFAAEVADPGLSPSADAVQSEQARAIQQGLEKLPDDYRRVILLRFQEERSFEEIGKLMNLTANAARKLARGFADVRGA